MSSEALRSIAGEPLLVDATERLLAQHCRSAVVREAERGTWPAALWDVVVASDLHLVGRSPDGSNGSLVDAAEVLFLCGATAVPLPIAETGVIGGWLSVVAGLDVDPTAPLTVPVPHRDDQRRLEPDGVGWNYRARYARVPSADRAQALLDVVTTGDGTERVVSVPASRLRTAPARALSGEVRSTVTVDAGSPDLQVRVVPRGTAERLRLRAGLSRGLMAAGAIQRCADLAREHAAHREQFGRALIAFQAIQHHVVAVAEEAAASAVAVFVAAAGLDAEPDDPHRRVAIARSMVDRGGRIATASAHQVLGAMGTTFEHDLNLFSRRVWTWNDEWTTGLRWAGEVGAAALGRAPVDLWDTIVAASTPVPP